MNIACTVRFFSILALVVQLLPGCGGGETEESFQDYVVQDAYTTKTADDWTIAVKRYRRASGVSKAEPVLLSQGYIEAERVFNGFTKYSLVERLALDGYDVWGYDIRGTGDSQTPEINWSNINFSIDWANLDWSISMPGWDYSIDHFVLLDTPAALNFVLKKTGRPQVIWIAHSIGALMQYALLETSEATKIKAAVSIGGIGFIMPGTDYQSLFAEIFYGIGTFLAPILPSNLPLPLKWALNKFLGNDPLKWAGVSYALTTAAGKLFWNSENMNANLVYQFLKYCLPDTTTNCFKQFMEWAKTGECKLKGVTVSTAIAGSYETGPGNPAIPPQPGTGGKMVIGKDLNITQGLSKIQTPCLVLAGAADLMCSPGSSQEVFKRLGTAQKKYHECSVKNGCGMDFGHIDLCMGKKARKEVYPHITDWLGQHTTPR